MAQRRGKGEGSIRQRIDGRWEARIDCGWVNGKRVRKSIFGRTRRDVANKLPKALQQAQQGTPFADERQTVERYLTRWLEHMQTRIRSRTWAGYEATIRLHLVPQLGKTPLAKLTPGHVDAAFQQLQQNGTSANRIKYARTVLRAALNRARKWQLVSQNVAALVDPPRHRGKEIQPLTPEQARTLIDSVRDHRLGAIVSVATALGLRQGEALGVRWLDVDFDAGTLRVRQALERSGGDSAARRPLALERREIRKRIADTPKRSVERRALWEQLRANRAKWRKLRSEIKFVEPKSARSRRTIVMPAVVVSALRSHRKRQLEERLAIGKAWQDSGLVFVSPIGTPLDPRNVTRAFQAMLAAAPNVPRVRFHDLRHTAATLLLAQGVDPRTIMETLGHSQISLTMNTYSHVLPALQAAAAAKLDAILSR
jgi:integrase